MKIEMLIHDKKTGTIFDVTQLVGNIQISDKLTGQPGKITFDFSNDGSVSFDYGSTVSLSIDDDNKFYGYVFIKKKNGQTKKLNVTAYDQLRYLKNKDTYVASGKTSHEMFEWICSDFQLKTGRIDKTTYVLPDKLFDDKSLGDILQDGLDMTLAATKEWRIIRDTAGKLEYLNINNLRTDLVIGDASLLKDYDYEGSIDGDTFNQIKVINEYTPKKPKGTPAGSGSEPKVRESYVVRDPAHIADWGVLQFTEKITKEANPGQLQERAEVLLGQKNRVTRKITLPCIGDWRVRSGNGIYVSIEDCGEVSLNQYMLVMGCTHTVNNEEHTMDIEVDVIV